MILTLVMVAMFRVGPYLQNLTDSSVTVLWRSATAVVGVVEFGFDTSYQFRIAELEPDTMHRVTLDALRPDTVYHYRVLSGADTSNDAIFSTPVGRDKPFRFIVYGDNRTDSASHHSVINRMLQILQPPQLLFNVGDLTENGTTPEYYTFFNIERNILSRCVLFPALGNHDIRTPDNWFNFFSLPGNQRWFTVRYGNAAFHIVDCYSEFTPGSVQYNWLLAELQADSANPALRHIFVILHEPPWTTTVGHGSNLVVRQYLCPLFERFRVTIVFHGHIHAYEHSLVNGVHYIITGGGGAPLHSRWDSAQTWTVYREATYEFCVVDVRGDSVISYGVRPDGSVFDSLIYIGGGISDFNPASTPKSPSIVVMPQPAIRDVKIQFYLAQGARVQMTVYEPSGRKVATLADRFFPAGFNCVTWVPPSNLPRGVYFCNQRVGNRSSSTAVLLIR
ncbi:MAG: metallophosphoesterase [bacterium]